MLNQFRKAICLVLISATLVATPSIFRQASAAEAGSGEGNELSTLNKQIQEANEKLGAAQLALKKSVASSKPEKWNLQRGVFEARKARDELNLKKATLEIARLTANIEKCVKPHCPDCNPGKAPPQHCDEDSPETGTPAAPSSLACEGVKSADALAAMEAFLRGHPDAKNNPPQLAQRAAKILGMMDGESSYDTLNITDMNKQGTGKKAAVDPKFFDNLLDGTGITLNHQTNFGLLQISPDRFRIHPKNTLDAMNRVFGQSAASLSQLTAVDDEKFFAACATPGSLREHRTFKGLGKELSKAGGKFSVEGKAAATGGELDTIIYIGKLLAACPRLNIELAHNEFEHTYGGEKGRLDYFDTRDADPKCQAGITEFLNAKPAESGEPAGASPLAATAVDSQTENSSASSSGASSASTVTSSPSVETTQSAGPKAERQAAKQAARQALRGANAATNAEEYSATAPGSTVAELEAARKNLQVNAPGAKKLLEKIDQRIAAERGKLSPPSPAVNKDATKDQSKSHETAANAIVTQREGALAKALGMTNPKKIGGDKVKQEVERLLKGQNLSSDDLLKKFYIQQYLETPTLDSTALNQRAKKNGPLQRARMKAAEESLSRSEQELKHKAYEATGEYTLIDPNADDEYGKKVGGLEGYRQGYEELQRGQKAYQKDFGENAKVLREYSKKDGELTKAQRLAALAADSTQAQSEIKKLEVDLETLKKGDSEKTANYLLDLKISDSGKYRRLVQIQSDYEALESLRIPPDVQGKMTKQGLLNLLRRNDPTLPSGYRDLFRRLTGRTPLNETQSATCDEFGKC